MCVLAFEVDASLKWMPRQLKLKSDASLQKEKQQ